jgi:hypothetical protein
VIPPVPGKFPSDWIAATTIYNDYSTLFASDNVLTYKMSGMPPTVMSTITFDGNSGVMSGQVPALNQEVFPMTLVITAEDFEGGSSSYTQNINIHTPNDPEYNPLTEIPNAYFGVEYILDVGSRFYHENTLTYEMSGTPEGSGFRIDPKTGVLKGTPNRNDLNAPQPIRFSITARDTFDNEKTVYVDLRVLDYQGIEMLPIPEYDATLGEAVFEDMSSYFTSPTGRAIAYSIESMPSNSNSLSILPMSGHVSGVPTLQDLNFQQPIPIIIKATDGTIVLGSLITLP